MRTLNKKAISRFFTRERKKKIVDALPLILFVILAVSAQAVPVLADYKSDISDVFKDLLGIIGTVFRTVGAVITAFAVGQFVLAMKDDDPSAKTRAATLIVVGMVLIAFPSILDTLKLDTRIK